ncbi:MAG: Uncharacterised protein [SAR116 cluster bacterium]|nr:MAG: Uncharacterised protein [SAR116 cluster bacterium]
MGYNIIANVDRMVTPATVNISSSSRFLCFGIIAAIAKAAEAPQIATEPEVKNAKYLSILNHLDIAISNPMVANTAITVIATFTRPTAEIISKLIRAPNRQTPTRRTFCAVKFIPSTHRFSFDKKFKAIPKSNAISIVGAP